jgi:hypothetical protein
MLSSQNRTTPTRSTERVNNLSLGINKMIEEFEKQHNTQILASSQGWLQYPDEYPNQKWVQLVEVLDSTSPIHRPLS